MYTKDQAIRKVIDTVNLMPDPESVNIDGIMLKYAVFRRMSFEEYETSYFKIAFALFGFNTHGEDYIYSDTDSVKVVGVV